MKNKDLNISIPKPCTQPWEEMTASGYDGRYCSHCQKRVIDFTTWSDAALHKFLLDKREKVCGRFIATQLNRPLSIPPQPHSRLYRIVVAMGLTLLAAEPATAQRMSPMDSVRAVYMLTGVQMAACNNGGFGTLFCEVRGDRYLPLHGAIVRITYEGKQIAFRETDSTGTMQFLLEPGLYSIRATYARYADTTIAQTIKIAANEITVAHLDFPYKTPRGGQTIVTGEVMDSEPVEHKAKAKTRNKRKADR